MEKKIDLLLESVDKLLQRMDRFEERFSKVEKIADKNEKRIENLDKNQSNQENALTELRKKFDNLKAENDDIKKQVKHELLSRDLYSKRFNYIIHGIDENPSNEWETRDQTEWIFRNFLDEGLLIEDPNSIAIADIHRLPQHPIFDKDRRKINRPIIVKFLNVFDKYKFTKNLKNLKNYNEKRRSDNSNSPYVYATEHLPKELQLQRSKLISEFRDARRNKRKTTWKLINSEYCLLVDGKRVNPRGSDKVDSDTSNDSYTSIDSA